MNFDEKKEWEAEKRTMERIFSGISGQPIRIKDANSQDIGYTSQDGDIYLSYHNALTDSVTKEEGSAIRMGVCFHETLHKMKTNFNLLTRTIKSMDKFEGQIFHHLDNLLEDAAIEEYASEEAGGYVLDSLEFAIAKSYELSPDVDKVESPFGQYITALTMFGDMGVVKGHFTDETAKKIFRESAPVFYKGLRSKDTYIRNKCSRELFKISEPLWRPEVEQAKQSAANFEQFMDELNKLLEQLGVNMNNGSGTGEGHGDGEDSESEDSNGSDSKKDSRRKITLVKLSKEEFEEKKKEMSQAGSNNQSGNNDGSQNGSQAGNQAGAQGSQSGQGQDGATEVLLDNSGQGSSSSGSIGDGDVTVYMCDEDEEKKEPQKKSGTNGNGESLDVDEKEGEENSESGKGSKKNGTPKDKEKDAESSESEGEGENANSKKDSNEEGENSEAGSDGNNEGNDSSESDSDQSNDSSEEKLGSVTYQPGSPGMNSSSENGGANLDYGDMDTSGDINIPENAYEVTSEDCTIDEDKLKELINEIKNEANKEITVDSVDNHNYIDKDIKVKELDFVPCSNNMVKVRDIGAAKSGYQEIVKKHAKGIKGLTNQLRRIFINDAEERVYKNTGRPNNDRIFGSKVTSRIFDKVTEPEEKSDFCIFLLIDESGSMCGNKAKAARECAIALTETFEALNIPIYVMGFTTGYNNALHNHYVTWNSPKNSKYSLVNITGNNANFDGYSIRYATQVIRKRKELHKLLIIIHDGQPCAVGGIDPVKDTAHAIRTARKSTNVLGILVGNEDINILHSMYQKDFFHISKVNDLFAELSRKIAKIVDTEM